MAGEVTLTPKKRSSRGDSEAPRARAADNRALPVVEIEELSDVTESINVLLHGDSGLGKTALTGLVPNAIYLTTERGVVAAKQAGSRARRIQGHTWDHVESALNLLDKKAGPGDWVIVDSATKMQVLLIRWLLGMIHEENDSRDLDIPAIQDHQKWQNMYKRYWDRLIDAPYNVIFITTSMKREDAEGDDLILPALTGKDYEIAGYCMAQTDIGLYLSMESTGKNSEPMRILRTQPDPPYWAKNRFREANIPGKIRIKDADFGTIPRMIQAIEKSGGGKAGKQKAA